MPDSDPRVFDPTRLNPENRWVDVDDTDLDYGSFGPVDVIRLVVDHDAADGVGIARLYRWEGADLVAVSSSWEVRPQAHPPTVDALSLEDADARLRALGLDDYPSDTTDSSFWRWSGSTGWVAPAGLEQIDGGSVVITQGSIRSVSLLSDPGPDAGVITEVSYVAGLVAENEQQRVAVEAEIGRRVQLRAENNAEIARLRQALVALNAAGRHFAKLEDGS